MGKRGPAPKPTKLKLLQGTYRKDRATANEPEPKVVKAPDYPSDLGKGDWGRQAIRVWKQLAPRLITNGLLTEVDLFTFMRLCDAYARWWYWRRELKEVGYTQVTASGYRAPQPEVGYFNKANEDLSKLEARFGLSPSDRTRISVDLEKDEKPENPFEALAGSR